MVHGFESISFHSLIRQFGIVPLSHQEVHADVAESGGPDSSFLDFPDGFPPVLPEDDAQWGEKRDER